MDQPKPDSTKTHVQLYGRVAKFPKNVRAKKAYLFLENVKVPKNKVWYLLVEKQAAEDGDAELQMLKYNRVAGVNLQDFVSELCVYYTGVYAGQPIVLDALKRLEVAGEDKFSVIRNISPIKMDGMPMVSRIMGDLIKLLA